MMTKTGWLDWVSASRTRLQQEYRNAWTRLPRSPKREQPEPQAKRWSAIRPEIDRKASFVEVHLELPQPHTVEAEVEIIGSTLAITVLRQGSGIDGAPVENCYRRSIPLPPGVDPGTAEHRVYGGEIVIRLQASEDEPVRPAPASRRRKPARTSAGSEEARGPAGTKGATGPKGATRSKGKPAATA